METYVVVQDFKALHLLRLKNIRIDDTKINFIK